MEEYKNIADLLQKCIDSKGKENTVCFYFNLEKNKFHFITKNINENILYNKKLGIT